jgi:transposase
VVGDFDILSDLHHQLASILAKLDLGVAGGRSLNSAAQLLLTAGDNPEHLRSEASFAALCGVSPVPASSGKTTRHRLNRGGDRAANSALHIIAIGRLRLDPKTQEYVSRRISAGHSKLEAIRCVKRYIAREIFNVIARRHKQINRVQIAA